jgi:hypothetical protein
MNTLVQRLSLNSTLVQSLLTGGFVFVVGLALWVMRLGGKDRVITWIIKKHSCDQDDAFQRITRGFKAFQDGTTSTACFDFIGGLDQWRAMQTHIARCSNRVRRCDFPIGAFVALTVAAFLLHILEPAGTWSGWCVAGSAIAFAWLMWNILPLAYIAWSKGAPDSATDGTATVTDKPVPQSQTGRVSQ